VDSDTAPFSALPCLLAAARTLKSPCLSSRQACSSRFRSANVHCPGTPRPNSPALSVQCRTHAASLNSSGSAQTEGHTKSPYYIIGLDQLNRTRDGEPSMRTPPSFGPYLIWSWPWPLTFDLEILSVHLCLHGLN